MSSALALAALLPGPAPAAAAATGVADGEADVSRARSLAFEGQRAQSLALLQRHLRDEPDDGEALVLLGTVLSWESRHDEARAALDQVLQRNPTHHDALRASINNELWSDHPERAEELARRGLAGDPGADDLREGLARAARLRRRLDEAARLWQVSASYGYDGFSDGRDDWHEGKLALRRKLFFGSLVARYYRSRHYQTDGDQFELEAFPKLRDGTYLDLAFAVSPQGDNYPYWRVQADLYQTLGSGFEGSVGYRRLTFSTAIDIFAITLTKYLGDWMLVGRSFITPGDAGTSLSLHLAVRRYFRDNTAYVALRYAHGASRDEIGSAHDVASLDTDSAGVDLEMAFGRFTFSLNAAYHRGERYGLSDLGTYSLGSGTAVRF